MEMSLGCLAFAGFIAAQFLAVAVIHREQLLVEEHPSSDASTKTASLLRWRAIHLAFAAETKKFDWCGVFHIKDFRFGLHYETLAAKGGSHETISQQPKS